MQPSAVIVVQPDIEFDVIVGLTADMVGRNPASSVDSSRTKHSPAARLISILAALRDPKAPAGLTPNLLRFASVGVLIAAEEPDLLEILETTGGMPFVTFETVQRGVHGAYVYGNLAEWRDAVTSGATSQRPHNVRAFYCKILALFETAGLRELWKDYSTRPLNDGTFLLEDRRR